MRHLRRVLVSTLAVPFVLAIGMTLVDMYRRQGRRTLPFPHEPSERTPLGDGSFTLYTYGSDVYDEMIAAIDAAEHEILFETYIWKGDAVGRRFKDALTAAAARGVSVYVIYDSFANLVVAPTFKRFPAAVHVLRYPVVPTGLGFIRLSRWGRDHRKIMVVDDDVAFVGGYNIGTTYATEWRDTHLQVTGTPARELRRAFVDFWNLHHRKRFGRGERPLIHDNGQTSWDPHVRVQKNVPRLWLFPIRAMYLDAITRSSRNVWLTTAYFMPDQDFVDALNDAAVRGVDVRILLPLKSNHIVADWIARGYFQQLLDGGVRIFRFRDAMIHAKCATVDGEWSTVGTANIDRLSLSGNYEVNMEVVDPGLARQLEETFLLDLTNSLELTETEWQARDVHRKFTELILSPLRPLL
jgi:cardiolipin synthase